MRRANKRNSSRGFVKCGEAKIANRYQVLSLKCGHAHSYNTRIDKDKKRKNTVFSLCVAREPHYSALQVQWALKVMTPTSMYFLWSLYFVTYCTLVSFEAQIYLF